VTTHAPLPEVRVPAALVARAVGAVALGGLALIHVLDLPSTITASPLVGSEYLGLIVASIVLAGVLLTRADPKVWLAMAGLAGATMFAYILSRTTGIPGDYGDIGNWQCSLGIAALTVESMLILLAGWGVRMHLHRDVSTHRLAVPVASANHAGAMSVHR
jgi:hypothetical protein